MCSWARRWCRDNYLNHVPKEIFTASLSNWHDKCNSFVLLAEIRFIYVPPSDCKHLVLIFLYCYVVVWTTPICSFLYPYPLTWSFRKIPPSLRCGAWLSFALESWRCREWHSRISAPPQWLSLCCINSCITTSVHHFCCQAIQDLVNAQVQPVMVPLSKG